MTFENLRSPDRQLIELRMEHADLNASIDRLSHVLPLDELLSCTAAAWWWRRARA